ncbi:vWA domain-containing protein [Dactylosporangium sp. CS-033363]|uniref:vWA domain-containing protein n=1 Tax=Dactylosporangium sp. CS-033363 TaxID=3239935 RepID=UPI003D8CAB98
MFEPRVNPDNPEPRAACALLLDTSASMGGRPIAELNAGLQVFADDIKENTLARKRAEVCVVTFGGRAQRVSEFQEAQHFQAPMLTAGGATPLAEAILLGLSEIEQQKNAYKQNGLEYFRPWMVIMSDGTPTDSDSTIRQAVDALRAAQARKAITVFPIGVGDEADMAFLSTLSTARPAAAMRDVKSFAKFFEWLSVSMAQVSVSNTQVSSDAGLEQSVQVALPPTDEWRSA